MNNQQIVKSALSDYRKKIFDTVEHRCRKFCANLCIEAISARKSAPGAHDFTGNLITSIVVCLYRDGVARDAWYSAQYERKAIRIKMRQRPVKKRYYFPVDYSGEAKTTYTPPADSPQVSGRYGVDDAKAFFQNYKPSGNNLFDIVIAYPVEYAEWIEMHRATTGIVQAYSWACSVGVQLLKMKSA